jgi:hypothetical protein
MRLKYKELAGMQAKEPSIDYKMLIRTLNRAHDETRAPVKAAFKRIMKISMISSIVAFSAIASWQVSKPWSEWVQNKAWQLNIYRPKPITSIIYIPVVQKPVPAPVAAKDTSNPMPALIKIVNKAARADENFRRAKRAEHELKKVIRTVDSLEDEMATLKLVGTPDSEYMAAMDTTGNAWAEGAWEKPATPVVYSQPSTQTVNNSWASVWEPPAKPAVKPTVTTPVSAKPAITQPTAAPSVAPKPAAAPVVEKPKPVIYAPPAAKMETTKAITVPASAPLPKTAPVVPASAAQPAPAKPVVTQPIVATTAPQPSTASIAMAKPAAPSVAPQPAAAPVVEKPKPEPMPITTSSVLDLTVLAPRCIDEYVSNYIDQPGNRHRIRFNVGKVMELDTNIFLNMTLRARPVITDGWTLNEQRFCKMTVGDKEITILLNKAKGLLDSNYADITIVERTIVRVGSTVANTAHLTVNKEGMLDRGDNSISKIGVRYLFVNFAD